MSDKPTVVAVFKTVSRKDNAASKKQGRPIFRDIEACEIRFSGDRNRVTVQPAHAVWKYDNGEPITYAMRFSDQYQRFKANGVQVQAGTPLEELPFLTQAKRLELKALSIYTAEALAEIDGQPLKNLGMGGRELKNQAVAYLEKANGSADVTAMASEIALLKQRLSELERPAPIPEPEPEQTEMTNEWSEYTDDELKALIKEQTGSAPRGQPSRETLVRMAQEATPKAA